MNEEFGETRQQRNESQKETLLLRKRGCAPTGTGAVIEILRGSWRDSWTRLELGTGEGCRKWRKLEDQKKRKGMTSLRGNRHKCRSIWLASRLFDARIEGLRLQGINRWIVLVRTKEVWDVKSIPNLAKLEKDAV